MGGVIDGQVVNAVEMDVSIVADDYAYLRACGGLTASEFGNDTHEGIAGR
jgi:hypothetical protein